MFVCCFSNCCHNCKTQPSVLSYADRERSKVNFGFYWWLFMMTANCWGQHSCCFPHSFTQRQQHISWLSKSQRKILNDGSNHKQECFFKSESFFFFFALISSHLPLCIFKFGTFDLPSFSSSPGCVFRFPTALGNDACHHLLSSLWYKKRVSRLQPWGQWYYLRGVTVVKRTAWPSVWFWRATCVPAIILASKHPMCHPAGCALIEQSFHRGTFNDTQGEHMDNISLRSGLFAESFHLRWQSERRTGCEEQACGQSEEQGGWTGSTSGWREGRKPREIMWFTFRMVYLAWSSVCLTDSQGDCWHLQAASSFLNVKLNLNSSIY